jgi:hypothetical protein
MDYDHPQTVTDQDALQWWSPLQTADHRHMIHVRHLKPLLLRDVSTVVSYQITQLQVMIAAHC